MSPHIRPSTYRPDTALPRLVGRERELDTLQAALQAALHGHGAFVVIGGEAGIGKTTLVRQVVAQAAALGASVLSGGCYDLELTPPYGPWRELLRTAAQVDGQALLDRMGGVEDAAAAQAGLPDALWSVLEHQAARQPLVLVLEDMHWADRASLDLLRSVVRRVPEHRLLVILTYRDVELDASRPLYRLLPNLVREGFATRLGLRRLDRNAMSALVAQRYAFSEADMERVVTYLEQVTEGNPFYIEEMLAQLVHDEVLRATPSGWVAAELDGAHRTPLLIRQVLDRRLEDLSPEALPLLELAAVIGSEVPLSTWQALAGVDDDVLADALEQALAQQLIVEVPGHDTFRFRHALVRQALYEQLGLLRRRTWHRRVAEWLEQQPHSAPEAIAFHFRAAHDPRAADWLLQAGRRAARAVAHRDALVAFEAAAHLLERDPDPVRQRDYAWLLCEMAEVQGYADARAALTYLDRAHDLLASVPDPALHVVVRWVRGRQRSLLGEAALPEVEAAMAACAQLAPDERRRVLHGPVRVVVSQGPHAYWLAHHGRFREALDTAHAFLSAPDAPPDTIDYRERGLALFACGIAHAALGQPEQALEDFAALRAHFRLSEAGRIVATAPDWEYDTLLHPYYPHRSAERHRVAPETASSWMRLATGPDAAPRITAPLCDALIRSGAWAEARTVASHLGQADVQRANAARTLAELDRLEGQPERAWSHVRALLPAGPDSAPGTLYFLATVELLRVAVELALDDGDVALARRWLATRQRWLDWSDGIVVGQAWQRLLAAQLHLLEGEGVAAWQAAEDALQRASDPRQPLAIVAAQRCLAHLDLAAGRCGESRARLVTALELAEQCDAPYEAAVTRLVQAELCCACGAVNDARALVEAVQAAATALGAVPLHDAATALLRDTGTRRDVPAAAAGLSARELEVLRLVAQGLTDAGIAKRLFISPRTVSGHMQSIFNKLGVSSRTAATAQAFERGLV
jgi:DNA-binding CsgD family transcriptional regulator